MKAHGINANGATIRNSSTTTPTKREPKESNKKRKLEQFTNDHAGGAVDDDEIMASVKVEPGTVTIKSEASADNEDRLSNDMETDSIKATGGAMDDENNLPVVIHDDPSSSSTGQTKGRSAFTSEPERKGSKSGTAAKPVGTSPSVTADTELTFLGARVGSHVASQTQGSDTNHPNRIVNLE